MRVLAAVVGAILAAVGAIVLIDDWTQRIDKGLIVRREREQHDRDSKKD